MDRADLACLCPDPCTVHDSFLRPGSSEAGAAGCLCPVLDNAYGRGYLCQANVYVMREDCPLHGKSSPAAPPRAAELGGKAPVATPEPLTVPATGAGGQEECANCGDPVPGHLYYCQPCNEQLASEHDCVGCGDGVAYGLYCAKCEAAHVNL